MLCAEERQTLRCCRTRCTLSGRLGSFVSAKSDAGVHGRYCCRLREYGNNGDRRPRRHASPLNQQKLARRDTIQAIKLGFNDTRCVMEPAGALAIAGMRKYLRENGLVGHSVSFASPSQTIAGEKGKGKGKGKGRETSSFVVSASLFVCVRTCRGEK